MEFQSTLPRGERRHGEAGHSDTRGISIHAPTWGATGITRVGDDMVMISIHAPTWGATSDGSTSNTNHKDFNPRSHVGSDQGMAGYCRKTAGFQSTLPRGERPGNFNAQLEDITFQSTLPRGERPGADTRATRPQGFQSTLPRGERLCTTHWPHLTGQISIHAPTWGATLAVIMLTNTLLHFNPRSHVGSDLCGQKVLCLSLHFNPRSHVGSDIRRFRGAA